VADGPNLNRRRDIAAALKKAKPSDSLTLEALALVWGVTKPRFVTVRNTMADFPPPSPGQANVYIYPAVKALKAMLAHETRHDDAARKRQERTNQILGRTARGRTDDAAGRHTVNELATLSKMRAQIEADEREQGLYAPIAQVAAVASEVFGEISEFMRGLSNKLDPHGLLDPEIRARIDKGGDDALLQLYGKMKDVLSPDAKPTRNRKPSGRARSTRARR